MLVLLTGLLIGQLRLEGGSAIIIINLFTDMKQWGEGEESRERE